MYANAFLPLDLKPDSSPDVKVTLRQGVTVRGRLLGPDGEPVPDAYMISRLRVGGPRGLVLGSDRRDRAFEILHGGRFEVHGLDPEKPCSVYFLDPRNKLGAKAEPSAKQAGEEVTVRLLPCGSATLRLVDSEGKPRSNMDVLMRMVVTPGATKFGPFDGPLQEDAVDVSHCDPINYGNEKLLRTDTEGRLTLPALVPGASYHIAKFAGPDPILDKLFTAESGKTLDLGAITVAEKK
jgi:hypothetical protein